MTTVLGKVYTPVILPNGFVVGDKISWHYNHYEPIGSNLGGDLCKRHTEEDRLVAAV